MAYQTIVPVKIPPATDSMLAVQLEAILTEPNWLITAYDKPQIGHGVAIFGKSRHLSGRPTCAYVYTSESHLTLERVTCSDAVYTQIKTAIEAVLGNYTLIEMKKVVK